MQEIVNWCNLNQGFISALLSLLAIFISSVAIFCTVSLTKRQNRVALFEKRQKVLDDIEDFVVRQLPSWELPISDARLFYQYSEAYMKALFEEDVSDFYIKLKGNYEKVLILWGDYKYAESHGECHGKNESIIEEEIHIICNHTADEISKLAVKILKTIRP